MFIQGNDEVTFKTIEAEVSSIRALVKGLDSIEVIGADAGQPDGCSVFPISKELNVYLLVKVCLPKS